MSVCSTLLLTGVAQAGAGVASPGVVVEEVAKESAGAKAGLQTGDIIQSWTREAALPANPRPAWGRIASPFDLADVEIEQAPRGPVTLTGRRREQGATWALSSGSWG